jgi:iron-sulfur cluster assembly protein
MLTISDVAAEKGKQMLTAEGKTDWGLRIYMAESSCCGPSFGMDINEHPSKDDKIIEKNGLKVFIDKNAFEKLNGMEIHFEETKEHSGFTLRGSQQSSEGHSCSSCG